MAVSSHTIKQARLDWIAKTIARCRVCKRDKVGLPVPGEGNPNAGIVFIGEAPGKQEAKSGRPFIGRSGKLLRGLIKEAGINENEVYITSPVKYLPKYITPTEEDVAHGRLHLEQQLKVIQPKIIVLLGRVAALALLKENVSVAGRHGTLVKEAGRTYLLTYHPAAPLYSPKLRQTLVDDFRILKRLKNNYPDTSGRIPAGS